MPNTLLFLNYSLKFFLTTNDAVPASVSSLIVIPCLSDFTGAAGHSLTKASEPGQSVKEKFFHRVFRLDAKWSYAHSLDKIAKSHL